MEYKHVYVDDENDKLRTTNGESEEKKERSYKKMLQVKAISRC